MRARVSVAVPRGAEAPVTWPAGAPAVDQGAVEALGLEVIAAAGDHQRPVGSGTGLLGELEQQVVVPGTYDALFFGGDGREQIGAGLGLGGNGQLLDRLRAQGQQLVATFLKPCQLGQRGVQLIAVAGRRQHRPRRRVGDHERHLAQRRQLVAAAGKRRRRPTQAGRAGQRRVEVDDDLPWAGGGPGGHYRSRLAIVEDLEILRPQVLRHRMVRGPLAQFANLETEHQVDRRDALLLDEGPILLSPESRGRRQDRD